ncbi:Rieske 2Fe-2S domain-containing protein [Streptomyces sp. NPDC059003]|uniref:Rieske 2Fe-2S domain-containing protein n=1 Tax=Streptomyces sp. NPDC059003 TaxID=3346691 RepID=UPI0036D1173D
MRVRPYQSPYAAQAADVAFPPPLSYPLGWFHAGFSREWAPGTVLTRRFMGADVVVYRTRAGALRATRPYCPHLGAHLGAGGTVDGEYLVCPFHRFAFAPDGSCARTPYGRPPKATLSLLAVRETYGIVWIWHSPDGTPPTWELPELPPVAYARTFHTVEQAGHPQDMAENAIDYGHATELHGFDFAEERSEPKSNGPLYTLEVRFGRRLPLLPPSQDASLQLLGLGAICGLINIPRYGVQACQWMLATPTGPWRMRYGLAANVTVPPASGLPTPLRRLIEHTLSYGMNRWTRRDARADQFVFQHKAYLPHPKLNDGDGPIGAYRHWAHQFYPAPHPDTTS